LPGIFPDRGRCLGVKIPSLYPAEQRRSRYQFYE